MCVRQRERKEGRMCVNTAGSEVQMGEGEKRMKNLIQSRVKYIKLMNIMIIQMNGAMRKIHY